MSNKFSGFLSVDEQGRVILPPEVAARLHLQPGQRLPYSEEEGGLRLLPAEDALLRVNIEPTSICNFDCRTCMRNAWDEPLGRMSAAVFERVLAGLAAFSPLPLVFFGGYGEPLVHPRHLRDDRPGEGPGSAGGDDHQCLAAGRSQRAPAGGKRAGPAVGLDRWGLTRKLRRCAPGRSPAAGHRKPRAAAPGAGPKPASRTRAWASPSWR